MYTAQQHAHAPAEKVWVDIMGQDHPALDAKLQAMSWCSCHASCSVLLQYAMHTEAVRSIVSLSKLSVKGSALKCSWARRKAQASGGGRIPAASLASHADVGLVGLPTQKYVGIQQQPAMQLDDYCQR